MKWPISSIVGIISVPLFWLFLLISLAFYPGNFSPLQNYLSDLGYYPSNPGAIFYNLGTIIAGCLSILFSVFLFIFYNQDRVDRVLLNILQVVGIFSGISIVGAAVFTEVYMDIHFTWSMSFFVTSVGCSIIGGVFFLRQPDSIRRIALFNIIVAFVQIALLILALSIEFPVLEWCVFVAGQINVILTCFNYAHMFKGRKKG